MYGVWSLKPRIRILRTPALNLNFTHYRKLADESLQSGRMFSLAAGLILILMTSVLVFAIYGLFQQTVWVLSGLSRNHFNGVLMIQRTNEAFVRSLTRNDVAVPVSMIDHQRLQQLADAVLAYPSNSLSILDKEEWGQPLVLLTTDIPISRERALHLAERGLRFAFLSPFLWSNEDKRPAYVVGIDVASGRAILSAREGYLQKLHLSPATLQQLLERIRAGQLAGNPDSPFWLAATEDQLERMQMFNCVLPVRGPDGTIDRYVVTGIPTSSLPQDVVIPELDKQYWGKMVNLVNVGSSSLIWSAPDSRLTVASLQAHAPDLGGAVVSRSWFDHGFFYIAGRTGHQAWGVVYAYPVSALLLMNLTSISWILLVYVLSVSLLFFAVYQVRHRYLRPWAAQLKRAREAEASSRQAAIAANEAKSTFLATMSHEIRTPLYGMLGTLDLLSESDMPATRGEALQTMRESSQTLLAIIDDILDFSRIESGALRLEHLPYAPVPILESVVRSFYPLAHKKGLKLYCQLQPGLPELLGDATRLRQIVGNLLSNAIKFTQTGSVTLRLWLEARSTQLTPIAGEESAAGFSYLVFSVRDTGIGIDPATQKQLFEPFIQADASVTRQFGGTGLGLSICRRLVHLMGGEISLQSEPDVGSCFTVSVPAHLAAVAPNAAAATPPELRPVVDLQIDDPQVRDNIAQQLQKAGYPIHIAGAPVSDAGRGIVQVTAGTRQGSASRSQAADPGKPVIRLLPDGPLIPQQMQHEICASLYSQESLSSALSLASGQGLTAVQNPALPPVQPIVGLRILIAEDHPLNRQLLKKQLEALGGTVQAVENGYQLLEALQHATFDIIFTDVNMPGMDGYALARALRAQGNATPLIGITASVFPGERERCLAAGMNVALFKPILLKDLRQVLSAIVPTASAITSDVNVVDEDGLSRVLVEDPALQRAFVASVQQDLNVIRHAVEQGDALTLRRHAHRMRGAFSAVPDGEDIQESCRALELMAAHMQDEAVVALAGLETYIETFFSELPIATPSGE